MFFLPERGASGSLHQFTEVLAVGEKSKGTLSANAEISSAKPLATGLTDTNLGNTLNGGNERLSDWSLALLARARLRRRGSHAVRGGGLAQRVAVWGHVRPPVARGPRFAELPNRPAAGLDCLVDGWSEVCDELILRQPPRCEHSRCEALGVHARAQTSRSWPRS
jgi:hypothetical protein